MEICLYKSIVEYQNGNNEHVEELIEKFSPLLKKYAYKLKYEDALSDLILIFIETLNKIPIERFTKNDQGAIFNYLSHSIYNAYISLMKNYIRRLNTHIYYEDEWNNIKSKEVPVDTAIDIHDALEYLSEKEREVIMKSFFEGYRDVELAFMYGVTRQAICNIKRKSYQKMKTKFFKEVV
jgi:RNA polymerase sigma factor (sigma-70 family)